MIYQHGAPVAACRWTDRRISALDFCVLTLVFVDELFPLASMSSFLWH